MQEQEAGGPQHQCHNHTSQPATGTQVPVFLVPLPHQSLHDDRTRDTLISVSLIRFPPCNVSFLKKGALVQCSPLNPPIPTVLEQGLAC